MDKEMYDEFRKEKQKKRVGALVTILILFLVIGLSYFIYYKITSRNNLKLFITNTFNYLEKSIYDPDAVSGKYSIKFNGTTADEENKSLFKILNNIEILYDYQIDYKNKMMNLNINSSYYGDNLINSNLYVTNNNTYIYLDGLYDKYIKYNFDEEFNNLVVNVDSSDYKVVLSSIKTSLEESLKDEYFTKEKITINNKKVTKTALILNENNYKEFSDNFINSLLKDQKFLNSYARITGKEVSEVEEELNKDIQNNTYELTISLYSDYSNFVKLEIEDKEEKLTVSKINKGYEYIYEGEATYSGTLKIEEDDEEMTVNFTIKDSTGNNIIKIVITGTTSTNVNIEKKDVSNSINYDEITEEDSSKISELLLNNNAFINLIQDILSTDYSDSLNNIIV